MKSGVGTNAAPAVPVPIGAVDGGAPRATFLDAALKWALVATLAIAPLPLAGARPLAWSLLSLTSGALLAIGIACEFSVQSSRAMTGRLRIPLFLFALVLVWVALQAIPLEAGRNISPIWSMAATALDHPVAPAISWDREASCQGLLRLLGYMAIFLVAWRVARSPDSAWTILRAAALIGAAYALYGMIVYFSGNRTILWYVKWAYQLDLTSTFVNRNSLATFLGLSLIADFALLARAFYLHVDGDSWRTVMRSSIECVFWHARVTTACTLAASSALLFTHSRGGAIAALLGGIALVLSMLVAPSLRGSWRLSFGLLVTVVPGILIALNGSGLLERFASLGIGSEIRLNINSGTIDAVRDNFFFGTGLGTFQYVYAAYQPLASGLLIDHAHDDYLENVLELGIPAAIVFYVVLLLLVLECVGGLLRRHRDAIIPCAAVAASVLVASHSTVDFSMQMPAVAFLYAALLGIGVAQSARSAARTGIHAAARASR